MQKDEDYLQQQEFQTLLSSEDYNQLKSWKLKYQNLQQLKNQELSKLMLQKTEAEQMLKNSQLTLSAKTKEKYTFAQKCLEQYRDLKQKVQNNRLQSKALKYLMQYFSKNSFCQQDKQNVFNCMNEFQRHLIVCIQSFSQEIKASMNQNVNKQIIFDKKNQQLQKQINQKNEKLDLAMQQIVQAEITQIEREKIYNEQKQKQKYTLKIYEEKYSKLIAQNEILSQTNLQFEKENRQLQDELKQFQEHIKILKQSIKIQSRTKLQFENRIKLEKIKSNSNSPKNSKFQKEDYIKETLVDYSREIKNNLISIGNLSQEEIRQIGGSQLNTLIKFIKELQQDFQ